MTTRTKIALAALTAAVAVALVLAFTLNGAPARTPAGRHSPAKTVALFTPAQAAKTCSALRKSPRPLTAYALLVIGETVRVGGMHPTSSQAAKAQRILEGEIAATCPEFGDVPGQYASIQH